LKKKKNMFKPKTEKIRNLSADHLVLRGLLAVILTLICCQLPGAGSASGDLEKKEIREIAGEMASVFETKYILPAEGEKIGQLIRYNALKGVYDGLVRGRDLAERLQNDARSVNGDEHITVSYSPEYIKNSRDPDRQIMLNEESQNQARLSNYGFEEIRILPGNIGYLKMNSFEGSREAFEKAAAAMQFLASSYAVIIDLRWNPGGDSRMVQLISSYFLDREPKMLDVFHYRESDRIEQLWTLPFVPGKTLEEVDLYILTSGLTFSAAEAIAYDLQALKRATLVGEITMGGGHAVETVIVKDKFLVQVPHAVSINPVTGKNFQGTGVNPDVKAERENALTVAHIQALQNRIAEETNPSVKSAFQWALDGLPVQPVSISEAVQKSCTGTYGPMKITLEKGNLYYHFGPGKLRMAPINENYFLLENFDVFRVKILKTKGVVSAIQVHNKNGDVSNFPRTGE